MGAQTERDRRAKAYSYRAYRRRVQQAQAMAQRVQLAVVAGAALVLAILVAVNVFVSALPSNLTKYDMSATKLFLLALVALIEIVWNQEPEQPAIETPAATTTPSPTPTGPLTIQITGLEGAESIDDVWAVIEIPH